MRVKVTYPVRGSAQKEMRETPLSQLINVQLENGVSFSLFTKAFLIICFCKDVLKDGLLDRIPFCPGPNLLPAESRNPGTVFAKSRTKAGSRLDGVGFCKKIDSGLQSTGGSRIITKRSAMEA